MRLKVITEKPEGEYTVVAVDEMNEHQLMDLAEAMVARAKELGQVGRWMSDELRDKAIDEYVDWMNEGWEGDWGDQDYTGFSIAFEDWTDDDILKEFEAYFDKECATLVEMQTEKQMHKMLSGDDG